MMKTFLFIIGLILTGALMYFGAMRYAPVIQNDINARLLEAKPQSYDLTAVTMEVDGRDVTLNGSVASQEIKDDLEEKSYGVNGVRHVKNLLMVEPSPMRLMDSDPVLVDESFNLSVETTPTPDTVTIDVEPQVLENTFIDVTSVEVPEVMAESEMIPVETAKEIAEPTMALEEPVIEPALPKEDRTIVNAQDVDRSRPYRVVSKRVTSQHSNEVAEACQSDLENVIGTQRINFTSGGSTINKASYGLLNKILAVMKNCNDGIIQVHGHTDSQGDADANRNLSLARSKSVGTYLLKNGVANQVRVFGHGQDRPIATNDTEEGRAQNRRIEFKVIKK